MKDFAVLVKILKKLQPLFDENQYRSIVSIFATELPRYYPAFNSKAFRKKATAK